MEKYTKFDDKRTGINPFVPRATIKRNILMLLIKMLMSLVLVPLKLAFIFALLIPYFIFHILKFIFIFSIFIRFFERLVDKIYCTVFLLILCVWHYEILHREHPLYEKDDNKRDMIEVDMVGDSDIIVVSSGSFIDSIILMMKYSPRFCVVSESEDEEQDQVKELSLIQTILYSLGLKFYKTEKSQKYEALQEILKKRYIKKPIALFIEGTKTNRRGILEPSAGIMHQLYSSIKNNTSIHSIAFTHNFKYFSPYNTIGNYGILCLIGSLSQVYHEVIATYYYNVEIKLNQEQDTKLWTSYVKQCLMTTETKYDMALSYRDHIKFLEYFNMKENKEYSRAINKNK